MEKKKTKLKLSGNIKKSITNIERAKSQGTNSVVIEKNLENLEVKDLLILIDRTLILKKMLAQNLDHQQ